MSIFPCQCQCCLRNAELMEQQIAYQAALAARPAPVVGDDGLDFEPDDMHTVSDMANVGYSLMQAIKRNCPDYTYNDSPAEIVADLMNERDAALSARPSVEGESDTSRLDWLDTQCCAYGFEDQHEGNEWKIFGAFASVRAAIDAELKAAREEGK